MARPKKNTYNKAVNGSFFVQYKGMYTMLTTIHSHQFSKRRRAVIHCATIEKAVSVESKIGKEASVKQ